MSVKYMKSDLSSNNSGVPKGILMVEIDESTGLRILKIIVEHC